MSLRAAGVFFAALAFVALHAWPARAQEATPTSSTDSGSLTADTILVVEGEQGKRLWTKVQGTMPPPRYPKSLARMGVSACLNLGMVIEPDGTTSNWRVLKSDTSLHGREHELALGDFIGASRATLAAVRYEPGPDNPGRIRGFIAVPIEFVSPAGNRVDNCRIENLAAFMAGLAKAQAP